MIIQFFKGPNDGQTLKIPDELKEYICETISPNLGQFPDYEAEVRVKRVHYYIDHDPRPDGVYWAVFEGVEIL